MTRRLLHHSKAALLTTVLAVALVAGCSSSSDDAAAEATSTTTVAPADDAGKTPEEVMAANLSYAETAALVGQTWDASDEVAIMLSGSSASADGPGVTVKDSTVTIAQPGTYVLSGTLEGQVVVDSAADGVVRLVLDGADITSATTAAVTVTDADQVSVVLADGSSNSLTDATQLDGSDEEAPNAALFSTADLAISGGGSLTVTGRAKDGIGAKDGLVVAADITVTAVDDGVRGKDYLVVDGGTLVVESGDDGLKSDTTADTTAGYIAVLDGTVTVTSAGDGLAAETDVVVAGGTVDVTAGGGSTAVLADDASAKGLKGDVGVVVGGDATVTIDAADDGLHSNGAVSVSGGTIQVATSDDGMHADGDLTITDGQVTVSTSNEGLEGTTITLAGGTLDITASDDAVNASDGSGSTNDTGMPGGAVPGGTAPTMPDGEMPSMPDGQMPDGAGGTPPVRPDGAVVPDGTAPTMPDSATMPDRAMQGGGMDQVVDGVSLTISGGKITLHAGGDGLDSNGTMTMTGGEVVVHGPTSDGDGAIDVAGAFTIEGGTLVALGSSGMAQTPDADSPQGWVAARFDSALAPGTALTVLDADGDELTTVTLERSAASVVFSAAGVTSGAPYTVTADGQTVATATSGEAIVGGGPGARG